MKNVYIYHSGQGVSRETNSPPFFVPYVYGLLRAHAERDIEIRNHYEWKLPLYYGHNLNTHLDLTVDPDVVGFSCYLWNWERVLFFSKLIKDKYPKCTIVFGGPQPPIGDKEFFKKYPWIDLVVHKEGEEKFYLILKELLKDTPTFSSIKGITFNVNGEAVNTGEMERLNLQDAPPSPLVLGYFDEYIEELKEFNENYALTFETNRGCPYLCTFCEWGSNIASKVRHYKEERMYAEIEKASVDGYKFIYGADANYGMFSKDVDYIRAWIECKKKYGTPVDIRLQNAKNSNSRVIEIGELIQQNFPFLERSTLAVQSMNEEVLRNIKRENIGVKNYLKLNEIYHEKKVETCSGVILALPGETSESWVDGLGQLADMNVTELILFPFMITPNAPIVTDGDTIKYKYIVKKIPRPDLKFSYNNQIYSEHSDVAMGTSTMSEEEVLTNVIYFHFIDHLHFHEYLTPVEKFLKNEHGISYQKFYKEFFLFNFKNPTSFIGSTFDFVLKKLFEIPSSILTNNIGQCAVKNNFINTEEQLVIKDYLNVNFTLNLETFLYELKYFITNELKINDSEKLKSLMQFQEFYICKPQNISKSEEKVFDYDWMDLLANKNVEMKRVKYQTERSITSSTGMNESLLFVKAKTNFKIQYLLGKPLPVKNNFIAV